MHGVLWKVNLSSIICLLASRQSCQSLLERGGWEEFNDNRIVPIQGTQSPQSEARWYSKLLFPLPQSPKKKINHFTWPPQPLTMNLTSPGAAAAASHKHKFYLVNHCKRFWGRDGGGATPSCLWVTWVAQTHVRTLMSGLCTWEYSQMFGACNSVITSQQETCIFTIQTQVTWLKFLSLLYSV